MIMNKVELERKLKRERVDVCLNCNKFVLCHHIAEYEECCDFEELEGEAWVIKWACSPRKQTTLSVKVCPEEVSYANNDQEW
jgi:hypothetical protein